MSTGTWDTQMSHPRRRALGEQEEMRRDERNQVKVSGHSTSAPRPVDNLLPPSLRSVALERARQRLALTPEQREARRQRIHRIRDAARQQHETQEADA